jgi:DNA-binding GntR family transcriptional regulator
VINYCDTVMLWGPPVSLPDWSKRISRDDPRLLSEQVAGVMREEIAAGGLTGRIPAEYDLADTVFSVSRTTLRRAVAMLVEEGLLTVQLGRGTFVVKPPAEPKTRRRR